MKGVALWAIVVAGLLGVVIFGASSFKDWDALQKAYREFEMVASQSQDLSAITIAEAKQNIHRINLFAEGVWTLLSAILTAIGVHGIAMKPPNRGSN